MCVQLITLTAEHFLIVLIFLICSISPRLPTLRMPAHVDGSYATTGVPYRLLHVKTCRVLLGGGSKHRTCSCLTPLSELINLSRHLVEYEAAVLIEHHHVAVIFFYIASHAVIRTPRAAHQKPYFRQLLHRHLSHSFSIPLLLLQTEGFALCLSY